VFVNSLRSFLASQKSNEVSVYAYEVNFMSGGAGYLISQKAFRLLAEKENSTCNIRQVKEEDMAVANCFKKLGVPTKSSLDNESVRRFQSNNVRVYRDKCQVYFLIWDTFILIKKSIKNTKQIEL